MNDKKNTVIWGVVMALLLIGFQWLNKPTQEQLEAQKRYADSLRIEQELQKQRQIEAKRAEELPLFDMADTDSVKLSKANTRFGEFAQGAFGEEKKVKLENELMTLELSTKGANVSQVILKEYQNYKKEPLALISEGDNRFSIDLMTYSNRHISSEDLNFQVSQQTDSSVVLSVPTEGGSLDFCYTLPANSYMVDFDVKLNNLDGVLKNSGALRTNWEMSIVQQEKGRTFEGRYAQIYYYSREEGLDELDEMSDDKVEVEENDLRWIAFKDQYFSSILIADGVICSTDLKSKVERSDSSKYLKYYEANFDLPMKQGASEVNARYFFGPNHYRLLKSYDENLSGDDKLNLKQVVSLGWFIFRWVNQLFTIPLFNLLGDLLSNYGVIILIMTIVLKLLLFPLTYKSYLSTAKMKVLKPQIDEVVKKIPEENAMERQQAMMEIYQTAGVNPMGGCLPMLLQMPFLVAFFYFFPNAIELRGESFLWAEDLSTYDAILSWDTYIWPIGNHLSLFCLLMTAANIIYTYFNMSMTDSTNQMGQMPFMKWMMYLMPLMFLFIFNDYASGLSYYYFVSLLITILQTFIIRKFCVNEEKLLKKIEERQKNPEKKKAGFGNAWAGIAEMAKRQQEMLEEQRRQQQAEKNK
jgi:YidC/Oxa1 family membrane protein insertase